MITPGAIIFYVLSGIIFGLFVWAKVNAFRATNAELKATAATNTANASKVILMQSAHAANDERIVKLELVKQQREDQAKIDTGDRSGLDKDTF